MNRPPDPYGLTQTASHTGPHEGYMPGFGNDFETEALPGVMSRKKQIIANVKV